MIQLSKIKNKVKSNILFLVMAIIIISNKIQSKLNFVQEIQAHSAQITGLQFYNDYSKFVTSSKDKSVIVWNMTQYSILKTLNFIVQVNGIGINPSNNQIIVLLKNGFLEVYDPLTFIKINSYSYPNSGYANSIQFISTNVYVLGGFDGGSQSPNLHFFNSNTHSLQYSISTQFSNGKQITKILNANDQIIFVISNQASLPIALQMYTLTSGVYSLAKRSIQSNAKIKDLSISMQGANFYTIAEDMMLRYYSASPFNNLYQVYQLKQLSQIPLAVNGLVEGLIYLSNSNSIKQYLQIGDANQQSALATSGPITLIKNLYPSLICTTSDGKIIFYNIQIFDGIDKDMTKWIIISSLLGGTVVILIIALIIQVKYCKQQSMKKYEMQQQVQLIKNGQTIRNENKQKQQRGFTKNQIA